MYMLFVKNGLKSFFSFFVTPIVNEPMCEIHGRRMVWHTSKTNII